MEDSAGRTATFGYTGGNLTSLTLDASSTGDPITHEWAFSYNSAHELTDWWSPDNEAAYAGNAEEATKVAYDAAGQVTSVTQPAWLTQCDGSAGPPYCSPETTFSYPDWNAGTDSGSVLVADPNMNAGLSNGNVTLDRYVDGVLVGKVQGYGFEPNGKAMTSAVTYSVADPLTMLPELSFDADGNETETSYDASGNVVSSTDPMGNTTTYAYNAFDEVTSTTDPMGYTSRDTYDAHGNLITSTDNEGDESEYAYTPSGLECAELSPNGVADGLTLDGCPTGAQPADTMLYGYDAEGDQVSVINADGDTSEYLYNSAGQVCAALLPLGVAEGETLPTSCPSTSAPNLTVTPALTVFGKPTETIGESNTTYGADGSISTYLYDAAGNQVASTPPDGNVGADPCNPATDSMCQYTTYTSFNPDDLKIASLAPSASAGGAQQKTAYYYDPDGNLIAQTGIYGSPATCDPLATATCPDTSYSSYDNLAREVATDTAGAASTTYTYDAAGNNLTVTTPASASQPAGTTTNTYDRDGDPMTTTTADGETSRSYNGDGEEICTDQGSLCTSTPPSRWQPGMTFEQYDGNGSLLESTTPDGANYWSFLDADGNVVAETGPLGNAGGTKGGPLSGASCDPTTTSSCADTTYATFDGADLQTSQVLPPGTSAQWSQSSYYYDANGELVATTGPVGVTSSDAPLPTCDPLSDSSCSDTLYEAPAGSTVNVVDVSYPGLAGTAETFDAEGNLVSTTDSMGNATTYSYNAENQETEATYSDGTPTVSITYTASGERSSMTDGTGITYYGYNSAGQVCYVAASSAPGSCSAAPTPSSLSYGYDPTTGRLDCVSYPNAANNTCSSPGSGSGIVTYGYESTGAMGSVRDWTGNTFAFTYGSSGDGQPTSLTVNSGAVSVEWGYDPSGYETSMTAAAGSSALLALANERNLDGTLSSDTATVGSTQQASDEYAYAGGELQTGPAEGCSGSCSTYSYTASTETTSAGATFASASYNPAGELCWTSSTASSNPCSSPPPAATTYSFNGDGERTSTTPSAGEGQSYAWNPSVGELTCINTSGTSCSASEPTSSTTTYTYNGDGLRASAETGSGPVSNYLWSSALGQPQLVSDGTWDYVYGPNSDVPLEQISASGSTSDLLLTDVNDSVRGLVQLSSGTTHDQLVNYTDYDAYGNPITGSGGSPEAGGMARPQTGISSAYVGSTPWGFGGGYTDETGTVYLQARVYDPKTAQFLSLDPDVALTRQPYSYASQNPVLYSDPSGLVTWRGPNNNICALPYINCRSSSIHYATWRQAEVAENITFGAHPQMFESGGNRRFVDGYNASLKLALEVKIGSQSASQFVLNQIKFDVDLVNEGANLYAGYYHGSRFETINEYWWMFYPNGVCTSYQSTNLATALSRAGSDTGGRLSTFISFCDDDTGGRVSPAPARAFAPQPAPVSEPFMFPVPVIPLLIPQEGGSTDWGWAGAFVLEKEYEINF